MAEPISGSAGQGAAEPRDSVAVVIVTYNRADVLVGCLDGLAAQTSPPDAVFVVDNASKDHTPEVLEKRTDLPLRIIRSEVNLGGAGGFHLGVGEAYAAGYDRVWLMDDDVVAAPGCLRLMRDHPGPALMAVREDLSGRIVEKSALRFDLTNPFAIHPKRASVDQRWHSRSEMPTEVVLENVAFEGFMVHRRVIDAIGLPDPEYFIFYDDCDFAIRARRAGFTILGLRDAVLVRQLDFDQQHALDTWKGYYMYRNLFAVHFRYGENILVRLKPYLIALVVVLVSPLRGGASEARNVIRAILAAGGMRHVPPWQALDGAGPSLD